MKIDKIQNVVVKRVFVTSSSTEISILIGKPELFPPGEGIDGFFYCPFQITGVEDERVKYGAGADSLDAMFGAIRMLVASLESSTVGETLRWKFGDALQKNLGLPPDSFWKFQDF